MTGQKKTNAVRIMENLHIPFELLEYAIEDGHTSAANAALKIGVPEEQILKTLVVRGDKSGILMVCVPGGRELNLKTLATASGNKKIELVALREITPLTGYIRGGCSPVGTKKKYPVFIDESVLCCDYVIVNAGHQGLLFKLKPEDLIKASEASAINLTN